MASRTCWKCDRLSNMTLHGDLLRAVEGRPSFADGPVQIAAAFALYTCDHCGWASLLSAPIGDSAAWALDTESQNTDVWAFLDEVGALDNPNNWVPLRGSTRTFEDVPASIAQAATEAWTCLDAGALRGAIILARGVVEATAKAKGITTGRLVDKIDRMADDDHRFIRLDTKEAAHEIRHFGNDMAHGDFDVEVSVEDAETILQFMVEVLVEVFQGPAKVQRMKDRRALM